MIPLSCIKLFDKKNFQRHGGISNENFRYCETFFSDAKSGFFFYALKFSTPETFRNTEDSSAKTFGTLRWKKFRRKIVAPPLMHKTSGYQKLSEKRKGFSPKHFKIVRQKVSAKNCDKSFAKNFSLPESFRNTEEINYDFFATARQKPSTERSDTSSQAQNALIQKIFRKTDGFLH